MEKITLNVEGMSCQHCVNRVKKAVSAVPGVKSAEVSLESKTVTAELDAPAAAAQIKAAVEEAGYDVV
jgi:copper ion binding protein